MEPARSLLAEFFSEPAPERLPRALSTAQPVAREIARCALASLCFDDSPYDYPAMLERSAPK